MEKRLNESVAHFENQIKSKSDKRRKLYEICSKYTGEGKVALSSRNTTNSRFPVEKDEELDVGHAEGPKQKQFKAQYIADWKGELSQWKAIMTELAQPLEMDANILPEDYEKWLTPEQYNFVEKAVDHDKWLEQSNTFRIAVQSVLRRQQHHNYLKAYYEKRCMELIERRALQYFADHFTVGQLKMDV